LVYNSAERVVLDPDQQVEGTLMHFFATFRRTGSACATVKTFRDQKLLFPRRPRHGPRKGELIWGALTHHRALQVLHNPRYAGAFVFGRYRQRRIPDGRLTHQPLPPEEWHTLLPDAHPGLITWEEYKTNQKLLRDSAQARGQDRRRSPPREGPALLQGIVMCGVCGDRMTVRYQQRDGQLLPVYVCQQDRTSTQGGSAKPSPARTSMQRSEYCCSRR
jgi:hypothetical protein